MDAFSRFATEIARQLPAAAVECIVLIDSPCWLEYEALPLEAVHFLAPRNLMGNWSGKASEGGPGWLVDHFEGTLDAVGRYVPATVEGGRVPAVLVIEASEGVLGSMEEVERSGLDQRNMLTRHLLGPRPRDFYPHGWERLFPGARLRWARTSGSHFTLVHPPHVSLLLTWPFCPRRLFLLRLLKTVLT